MGWIVRICADHFRYNLRLSDIGFLFSPLLQNYFILAILSVKRWYVPHVHTQPCRFGLQSLSTVTNIPQTWSDLLTGLYDVLFQTNPCFWKYDDLALDQINRFKPETDKEWLCQIRNSPWKPIGGVPFDRFFGVYTIQYNQYTFLYTRVPISYQSEIQPEFTPPVSAFCLFSERCAFSFACFHFFQTPWLSRASSTVTKPNRENWFCTWTMIGQLYSIVVRFPQTNKFT